MSNKYTEENLIRAASYLPSEEEKQALQSAASKNADPLSALLYADDRDTVLYGIFGDVPDYSNPDIEALWDEVLDAEPEDVYEYCFKKGIDLKAHIATGNLKEAILESLQKKPKQHQFNEVLNEEEVDQRMMVQIGG